MNQEKAKFPAITICPISKGYKEDVLQVSLIVLVKRWCQALQIVCYQDHGIANVKAYNRDTTVMNWTSSKNGVSKKELFDLATYTPGEIVKEIYIRWNY